MSSPNVVVVSSSLSQVSRSRIMAHYAIETLTRSGCEVSLLDLAQVETLSYPQSKGNEALKAAVEQFNAAHGWVLASPVYNFGASGVLLNFLHYALDSDFGRWKPFVLMSSMSGQRSAMALDHVARTMVYEVMDTQLGVLSHFARARMEMK